MAQEYIRGVSTVHDDRLHNVCVCDFVRDTLLLRPLDGADEGYRRAQLEFVNETSQYLSTTVAASRTRIQGLLPRALLVSRAPGCDTRYR